jgi:hypothetical protein
MQHKNVITIFLAAVAVASMLLVSVACEPPLPTPEGESQSIDSSATPTTPPATPTSSLLEEDILASEPEAEKALTAAKADLMKRLGVAEEAILVKSVEAVQWRDSSLGCPQPGMMYAQVITPGFRIVLTVEGQTYEYHTDRSHILILCDKETGLTPVPVSPQVVEEVTVTVSPTIPMPASPGLQRLVTQAMEDLAQRLSIETDQIELIEATAVVWPDGSLGCPEPGVAYTQVQQEGMRIRLRAEKRIYSYHSGGGRPLFLCEQATTDG